MEALGAEIDGIGFNAAGIAPIANINIIVPVSQVDTGPEAKGGVGAAGVIDERLAAVGCVAGAGIVV